MKHFRTFLVTFISFAVLITPSISWADSDAHRAAAEELAAALDLQGGIENMRKNVFEHELANSKTYKDYRLAIEPFYARFMSFAVLKNEILNLLMSSMSEKELKEAAAFYSSPGGQKVSNLIPTLRSRVNRLVYENGRRNLPELQKLLSSTKQSIEPDLQVDAD